MRAAVQPLPANGMMALAAALLLACAPRVQADEGGARVPVLPLYQQECSACHVAYPARGLPAASWQRLMGNLPRHFGTDASLDAASLREISGWLQTHAATGQRASDQPADDRLTRTRWFVREHDEISPAVWRRASIGKASNCAACHTQAAQGRFSEHDVRIPK